MKDKITKITASGNSLGRSLQDLFQNLETLRAFTWRDLRIRYAQTYLGFTWSLLQPLLGLTAVFVLFFKIAGIDSGETPYIVFALSGLIFWNYFHYLVTQTASAFVHVQAMIKKIYFPRLSLPFSKLVVGSVDLLVGIALLIAAMLYYDLNISGLWIIPLVWIFTALVGLGTGLVISGLSLRYRDLQQALPFALQLLFFLSPIAYPSAMFGNLLSQDSLWITYINPITGILELLRHFIFGYELTSGIWISLAMSVLLFASGLLVFSKVERKMADIL